MITTELTKKELLIESLNELDFSNEPQFAQELRTNAKKALEDLEFPTSKTEYWKYTRIGKIINKNYGIQNEVSENTVDISSYLIPDMDANVVVLVNGFYRADLSKITPQEGIKINALKDAIQKEDGFIKSHLGAIAKSEKEIFIALNTLCFTDGVYIDLEKGTITEKPIHIINVITNDSIITKKKDKVSVR